MTDENNNTNEARAQAIMVKPETKERVTKHMQKTDKYDDIVNEMIDCYEKYKKEFTKSRLK
jgi:hypothetical protein